MKYQNNVFTMSQRKKIAIFFGGRSPEHDVSIVSALQVMQALDPMLYETIPVYITGDGVWLIGDALKDRGNYLLDKIVRASLTEVNLDINIESNGRARLVQRKTGFLGKSKVIEFDVAFPVFHGLYGEDGNIQGVFEVAGIPYTGMRTRASAVTMDKALSKCVMRSADIQTLDFAVLKRPQDSYHLPSTDIEKALEHLNYPVCVKPCHLGSSIGVAKCNNASEVGASLPAIFKFDTAAIVEPFVENLVEYNVALLRGGDGDVQISALERPKASDELLDFKQKYLSGGDNKAGQKMPGQSSEGMLSLTRELNPELPAETRGNIINWGRKLFDILDGTGSPRIDFIGNSETGEIWMNEINPCPGSLGYFLWEAKKDDPILFTDLLTHLIEEAVSEFKKTRLPADPVPMDARLHRRYT